MLKPARWPVHPLLSAAPELWRGCVVALPLWEGGSNRIYSYAPSRLHGSLKGGLGWSRNEHGAVLSLDGANHYVDLGSQSETQISGDLTLIAWASYDALGASNTLVSMGTGGESEAENFLGTLIVTADKSLRCFWEAGAAGANVDVISTTPAPITSGQLHQLAVTRSVGATSSAAFYADGELLEAPTTGRTNPSGGTLTSLYLGTANSVNQLWAGDIEQILVYDRALRADEIARLARDPYAMFRPARRRIVVAEAPTGVSANIGAGSITLTGKAMGVTAGQSLNMGAGSLSLTGQALGITYGQAMSIGAGSLTLSGKSMTFLEPLVPPSGIRQSRSTRIRRIRHGA